MAIDQSYYHGWEGKLRSPWIASLAIVRVALLQVLRRKSYWIVLALGMTNFLLFFSLIYVKTQLPISTKRAQDAIWQHFDFTPEPPRGRESGYIGFMDRQSLVVMILLAFSGSMLVGADFRGGALPFYLSRRIDRRHYIVGKLLSIGAVVALLTGVPALLLFIEYGMFTSSLDYYVDYWEIPLSIIGYSLVMCLVLGILLMAVSAYLQRTAPIAITWASTFVLLGGLSGLMRRATQDSRWELLDPWRDMRYVGKLCFGFTRSREEYELALMATGILTIACAIALFATILRVRAVEVVE